MKVSNQKTLLLLLAVLFLSACNQQTTKRDCSTYEEAKLPVEVTTDWTAVSAGLQASIGSIDNLYMQHEVPDVTQNTNWNGKAWKCIYSSYKEVGSYRR